MEIGKQLKGGSNYFTKRMALEAIETASIDTSAMVAADIGAGAGELTKLIAGKFEKVLMADVYMAPERPKNAEFVHSDLNDKWSVADETVDFLFALEVLEHVENPRHFFREMRRIIKPNGYAFLTTPNNHSIYSKLIFFFKGEHRYFQDPSYPAHITALTQKDMSRIASETNFSVLNWSFANEDAVPGIHYRLKLPGKLFSQSIGLLVRKK
jgi:2-polyprenyl-3-methyl-5-hydroxy-6-metoxy-1,4-benzoquinol methylase